ncbi:Na+/H+ antiporter subunit E [Antribacter gilvus]|uniref:Na+/H+ antiporter subunit E n=1 Tax=Antribacter gilvus TaxID=2304675 RepID=UPI000F77B5BE|nr:Na+/H+ antiporter subunit E [Antribacter gilvus]
MNRRTSWGQWRGIVVLTATWVLLWGSLSPGVVLTGLLVALGVLWLFPLPDISRVATVRLWPLCVLVTRFATDLFVASFQVAWLAVRPGPTPRGGVVGVRLTSPSVAFEVATAELASLIPGSVVVEIRVQEQMLYLHVLDLAGSGGPDGVRASVLALERRILRAFAAKEGETA